MKHFENEKDAHAHVSFLREESRAKYCPWRLNWCRLDCVCYSPPKVHPSNRNDAKCFVTLGQCMMRERICFNEESQ